MANTNPQAIRIVNEIIRPFCDQFAGFAARLGTMNSLGTAQGWHKLFPEDDEFIADGAPEDGRHAITNKEASAIITAAQSFLVQINTPIEEGKPTPVQLALIAAVNPR